MKFISGLNIVSEFNVENVTDFNNDGDLDILMDEEMDPEDNDSKWVFFELILIANEDARIKRTLASFWRTKVPFHVIDFGWLF